MRRNLRRDTASRTYAVHRTRTPIVDEEYGQVFAVFQFGNGLVPNELFKVMDGQIRLLNIVINGQSTDGWD